MTRFAIIDIETTGIQFKQGKITEIAILIYQNGQIVDQFESLINPETSIPFEITRITGITNEMVEQAPKFYEVAKKILEITHDAIFVAHNVQFDYSFVKEEFSALGYSFSRKKLCTVQLSRKHFPGLKSYALGNLIKHFNIEVTDRHRAYQDALATSKLFHLILHANDHATDFMNQLVSNVKDAKLPGSLKREDVDAIPDEVGVYYMCNESGDYVYIGKSINIRERIYQHFSETGYKVSKMLRQVHHIEYTLTGSELMAQLLESSEIKKYSPEINRAQRSSKDQYAIYRALNDLGYFQYLIKHKEWLDEKADVVQLFSSQKKASEYLDYLIHEYHLCEHVNALKKNELLPCYRFQIGICLGACAGQETKESYNERFEIMHQKINRFFQRNFILYDKGRSESEVSVFVIENGFCNAIGYLDKDISYEQPEVLKESLKSFRGNIETNGIINQYIKKHPSLKKIYF